EADLAVVSVHPEEVRHAGIEGDGAGDVPAGRSQRRVDAGRVRGDPALERGRLDAVRVHAERIVPGPEPPEAIAVPFHAEVRVRVVAVEPRIELVALLETEARSARDVVVVEQDLPCVV